MQLSSRPRAPGCRPGHPRSRSCSTRTFALLTAPPKARGAKHNGSLHSALTNASQQLLRIFPTSPDTERPQQSLLAPPKQPQPQQPAAPEQQRPALDVTAFLAAPSSHELRHMRMLAHLCSQTYYMGQLTPAKLRRWHNLDLVSSSLCCERLVYEHRRTDDEVLGEADGMAGPSLLQALDIYSSGSSVDGDAWGDDAGSSSSSSGMIAPSGAVAVAAANNVVPFPRSALSAVDSTLASASSLGDGGASSSVAVSAAAAAFSAAAAATADSPGQQQAAAADAAQQQPAKASGSWNPADLVAAKLSEAAAAASAAALQPLASAAGSLYAGSLSLVSSVTSSVTSTVTSSVTSAALGPGADRLVREAIAGITSAEIASSHPNSRDVKAASASTGSRCPSEWFVADDAASSTRLFVIQGSDSLDHWKTNLMFEPVAFEGPDSGIRVHRGAYEAALDLYERFLPLVQEQVDSDPAARVAFTGHSIGGALAVLLMLMFRRRGVLLPQQIAPVVTFGSPAIFCDGALGGCSACETDPATGDTACSLGTSLLSHLGLRDDIIRSVIMTRDIVPRAFSCDYSLVAELLRSWGPNWRDHTCLAGGVSGSGRRQLYVHIGRTLVLQPSPELSFVTEPSPGLPLLPQQPEVYELLPRPTLASRMAAARGRAAGLRGGGELGAPAASSEQVLAALMDTPHPLETLADPGAYGTAGSISRYHNPENYTRALGRVLSDRRGAAADALQQWVVPARSGQHRPFFPVSLQQQRDIAAAAASAGTA